MIVEQTINVYFDEICIMELIKHFERLLLLIPALVVGGGLGYKLLPDFEPMKIIIFAIVCVILGEVFYQIDKRISKK
ncbi:MAG: hypothetical protein Q4F28_10540 [Eubacteriales bacterium]|nr:hypothetical protein [Eubacteriales bacterium]